MLHLYRGDSYYNDRTSANIYRSDGLLAPACGGGGRTDNIENIGFLETIKRHIDHLKGYEKEYYSITDYISFTENLDTAKAWAADLNPANLVPCTISHKETRYVFHLKIPKSELIPLSKGTWEFFFTCNRQLLDGNTSNSLLKHSLRHNDCPFCNSVSKVHSIILVKPILVFPDLKDDKKYDRAKKLTNKNEEWLVLPNDPQERTLKHRKTRIPRADFWDVEHYNLLGERRESGNI